MTPLTLDGKPRPGSSVLHAGCGGEALPDWLAGYAETRLDIDPSHCPDVVADMTDIGPIGPFDLVWTSHALEHLPPEGAAKALREFHRVLKPGGMALVVVPDLEGVPDTEAVIYQSADAGPITGADMHHGLRRMLTDMPHMAHRSRFVRQALESAFVAAGFAKVCVRRLADYNLLGAGVK